MPVELWNKKRKSTARQPNPDSHSHVVSVSSKSKSSGLRRQSCSHVDHTISIRRARREDVGRRHSGVELVDSATLGVGSRRNRVLCPISTGRVISNPEQRRHGAANLTRLRSEEHTSELQ